MVREADAPVEDEGHFHLLNHQLYINFLDSPQKTCGLLFDSPPHYGVHLTFAPRCASSLHRQAQHN